MRRMGFIALLVVVGAVGGVAGFVLAVLYLDEVVSSWR